MMRGSAVAIRCAPSRLWVRKAIAAHAPHLPPARRLAYFNTFSENRKPRRFLSALRATLHAAARFRAPCRDASERRLKAILIVDRRGEKIAALLSKKVD
jgi:hypothetical protein